MARPPDTQTTTGTRPAGIACPKCATPIEPSTVDTPPGSPGVDWAMLCPKCGVTLALCLFPALQRQNTVARGVEVLQGDEATCFYHEGKQAEESCSVCGRFVCGLCHIQLGGRHVCPHCVGNEGVRRRHLESTEPRRTHYGQLVSLMAVIPLVIPFSAVITFPVAIGLSLHSRGRPKPLASSTLRPMVAGLILSGLEFVAALVLIYFIASGSTES